ncbi:MAG: hypothetical protein A3J75_01870, partial [Acidobacteria bacterium RBG_16_68_9]
MTYQRKDAFYTHARAAGYRSRAAYKLLELARRYRVVRPGDHVVDLGAWPGGWLQVAAELVGQRGRVVGVDLVPIEPLPSAVVSCVTGDARDPAVREDLRRRCDGRVDVLLSDMAPKLTGVRATDTARAAELAGVAVAAAGELLQPGGRLLMKVFTGEETDRLVHVLRAQFTTVKVTRPDAS